MVDYKAGVTPGRVELRQVRRLPHSRQGGRSRRSRRQWRAGGAEHPPPRLVHHLKAAQPARVEGTDHRHLGCVGDVADLVDADEGAFGGAQ